MVSTALDVLREVVRLLLGVVVLLARAPHLVINHFLSPVKLQPKLVKEVVDEEEGMRWHVRANQDHMQDQLHRVEEHPSGQ